MKAHFIFNPHRPDLVNDHNEHKHYEILKRSLQAGGRRDIFLGTRECQAYVEPCVFGEGEGFYDNYPGEIHFGTMFHGFNYPDETGDDMLEARLWQPMMKDGYIKFIEPAECPIINSLRAMEAKDFKREQIESADELFANEIEGR